MDHQSFQGVRRLCLTPLFFGSHLDRVLDSLHASVSLDGTVIFRTSLYLVGVGVATVMP